MLNSFHLNLSPEEDPLCDFYEDLPDDLLEEFVARSWEEFEASIDELIEEYEREKQAV